MYLNHSSQKEIRFLNALGDDLIAVQRGYVCYGLVIEICHIASECSKVVHVLVTQQPFLSCFC